MRAVLLVQAETRKGAVRWFGVTAFGQVLRAGHVLRVLDVLVVPTEIGRLVPTDVVDRLDVAALCGQITAAEILEVLGID